MRLIPLQLSGLALALFAITSQAASVQRCEDEAGNITFTSLGCPSGHDMRLQSAFNAPPGSVIEMPPPASQPKSRLPGPATKTIDSEILVIGQRDDGCGNRLSADQRRRAIINQRTPPGMTLRDVESLLGKPDKIMKRNSETRYTYTEKKGRSTQVTFDENDCVKGKR